MSSAKTGFWAAVGAIAGGLAGATAGKYAAQYRPRYQYAAAPSFGKRPVGNEIEDAMVIGGAIGATVGAFIGGTVAGEDTSKPELKA